MKHKSGTALATLARQTVALAVLSCASLFAASQAQAAALTYDGSKVIGAAGIDVNGTVYDVSFKAGSCAEVFSVCNESSVFDFDTQPGAKAAADALFKLLAGIKPVDLGLNDPTTYSLSTPFKFEIIKWYDDFIMEDVTSEYVYTEDVYFYSYNGSSIYRSILDNNLYSTTVNYSNNLYADWTLAAPSLASTSVPVPAPLPILGAVAAIGWSRKLRRRIRESQALAA